MMMVWKMKKTISLSNNSILGKVKNEGLEFVGALGKAMIEKQFENPQRMEKSLKKQLDKYFKGINPKQLEQAFEDNVNIAPQVAETTKYYKHLAEEMNIDTTSIKQKIQENAKFFNNDWLMDYLQTNHIEFYNRIVVHPNSSSFKAWLSGQIQLIYSTIIANL